MTYCRLWQALINKDLPSVKRYSEQLNAGHLYQLLACLVCARAWDSIKTGIDQSPMSKYEVCVRVRMCMCVCVHVRA